jgi:hypothetical protein
MRLYLSLVALLILGACARADEPWLLFDGCHWTFPKLCEQWRQRSCWCPNDYCPKTLPHVTPNPLGCVDDYCKKTLPCVGPNGRGCVDDYCPKTCPLFLGNLCEPWYRCPPKP